MSSVSSIWAWRILDSTLSPGRLWEPTDVETRRRNQKVTDDSAGVWQLNSKRDLFKSRLLRLKFTQSDSYVVSDALTRREHKRFLKGGWLCKSLCVCVSEATCTHTEWRLRLLSDSWPEGYERRMLISYLQIFRDTNVFLRKRPKKTHTEEVKQT